VANYTNGWLTLLLEGASRLQGTIHHSELTVIPGPEIWDRSSLSHRLDVTDAIDLRITEAQI
jgi:hypothetical protein